MEFILEFEESRILLPFSANFVTVTVGTTTNHVSVNVALQNRFVLDELTRRAGNVVEFAYSEDEVRIRFAGTVRFERLINEFGRTFAQYTIDSGMFVEEARI